MMWPSTFQNIKEKNKEQFGSNQLEENLKPKKDSRKSAIGEEIDLLANCKYKRKDQTERIAKKLAESKDKAEKEKAEEEKKKIEERKQKVKKKNKTKMDINPREPAPVIELLDQTSIVLSDDQKALQDTDVIS